MASGEKLYKGSCVACHELDGSGAPRIYPPLPGNANLQSENPASAIKIVLDGAETITTPRAPNTGSMPPYASKMSDQDVADVVTYIRNAWGNAAPAVTPAEEVAKRGNREAFMVRSRRACARSRRNSLPILVEHEFRHFPFVADREQTKRQTEHEGQRGPELVVQLQAERGGVKQSGDDGDAGVKLGAKQ